MHDYMTDIEKNSPNIYFFDEVESTMTKVPLRPFRFTASQCQYQKCCVTLVGGFLEIPLASPYPIYVGKRTDDQ